MKRPKSDSKKKGSDAARKSLENVMREIIREDPDGGPRILYSTALLVITTQLEPVSSRTAAVPPKKALKRRRINPSSHPADCIDRTLQETHYLEGLKKPLNELVSLPSTQHQLQPQRERSPSIEEQPPIKRITRADKQAKAQNPKPQNLGPRTSSSTSVSPFQSTQESLPNAPHTMASSGQYPASFKWARAGESNEWKGDRVGLNKISTTSQPHRDDIAEYSERIPDGMQQLADAVARVDAIARGVEFR